MARASCYEMFILVSIFVLICAIVSIIVWRWKAVIAIAVLTVGISSIIWLPGAANQWKFSQVQKERQWRIVYSPELFPQPIVELRLFRSDKTILGKRSHNFRNPSLSGDGTKIAFALSSVVDEENHRIGIAPIDGGEVKTLPNCSLPAEGISWSPDGRWIAFWSHRNSETESMDLSLYDLQRSTSRRILKKATFYGTCYTPSWSPDSSKILFASHDGYVTTIDTATLKTTKIVKGDAPSWSPDGATIIYREGIRYSKLPEERLSYYSIKPDGTGREYLFDGGPTRWNRGDVTQPVVWSPDSRYAMYFRAYDPPFDTNFSKIYILDLTNKKTYLIKKKKYVCSCSWGRASPPAEMVKKGQP